MKIIFYFSIIVVTMVLMSSKMFATNNGITDQQAIRLHHRAVEEDIANHDWNMTTDHSALSDEHGNLDTKLDQILDGGGGGGLCSQGSYFQFGTTHPDGSQLHWTQLYADEADDLILLKRVVAYIHCASPPVTAVLNVAHDDIPDIDPGMYIIPQPLGYEDRSYPPALMTVSGSVIRVVFEPNGIFQSGSHYMVSPRSAAGGISTANTTEVYDEGCMIPAGDDM